MNGNKCSVDVCDRQIQAKGFCLAHYKRMRNTGTPGGAIGVRKGRGAGLETECTGPECIRMVGAKSKSGLCNSHWSQLNRGAKLTPLLAAKTRDATDALLKAGSEATGNRCILGPNGRRPLTVQSRAGQKRTTLARAVWEAAHGPIVGESQVLHWCQDEACVNVRHIYLGTSSENAADRAVVYEIGRAIIAARVQAGGPGVARGIECDAP